TGCTDGNQVEYCAAGYYCPAGTYDHRSLPCPPGTFSGAPRASSRAACGDCLLGHFCGALAQTQPDKCPQGHFCGEKGLALPTACPPGTYNDKVGSTSEADCLLCPAGSFCPAEGTSTPKRCPAGTYNDGSTKAAACSPCPAGHKCPLGTSSPAACAAGEFSRAGAAACEVCLAGHFCEKEKTTFEEMTNNQCPPGLACELPGIPITPTVETHGCPAGMYCTGGSSPPQPCPVGTYGPSPGATSAAECLLSPAGTFVDTPGASQPSGKKLSTVSFLKVSPFK
ncbi:hypothetical protein, conserved, partial [Eimeria necatrix]